SEDRSPGRRGRREHSRDDFFSARDAAIGRRGYDVGTVSVREGICAPVELEDMVVASARGCAFCSGEADCATSAEETLLPGHAWEYDDGSGRSNRVACVRLVKDACFRLADRTARMGSR